MQILVLNPGGNSLKAEIVRCSAQQQHAFDGHKLISVSVEGIGKEPKLLRYDGKSIIATEPIEAASYEGAAESLLSWFENHTAEGIPKLAEIDCVGVRVVHGGHEFSGPTEFNSAVGEKIHDLEKLAPLHNKNSLELLKAFQEKTGRRAVYAVFDTAFHRSIPEDAALYPIPLELSDKHRIRRYGFHGISHRYLLERYAHLAGRRPDECNLVTMHLESGC